MRVFEESYRENCANFITTSLPLRAGFFSAPARLLMIESECLTVLAVRKRLACLAIPPDEIRPAGIRLVARRLAPQPLFAARASTIPQAPFEGLRCLGVFAHRDGADRDARLLPDAAEARTKKPALSFPLPESPAGLKRAGADRGDRAVDARLSCRPVAVLYRPAAAIGRLVAAFDLPFPDPAESRAALRPRSQSQDFPKKIQFQSPQAYHQISLSLLSASGRAKARASPPQFAVNSSNNTQAVSRPA